MAYKIPWSNFHELNLDWLLQQVKQLREDVDGLIGSATPSDDTPEMDGVGAPGTSVSYSRGDHRHPTDTSRAAASDLTQEITDRGNADLALASDIADVDAKIKFSAAAPLMDSSSASAGFSDYLARADHVHPTDTSRASATDLATLTVRVDNITGAASPYDVTPLMDGAGSYGTVGAYSRGDHQHPSDTSKLDKAGGEITGDLILDGELELVKYSMFGITNATGWIRIATVPDIAGTNIQLLITRRGSSTPAETHSITLSLETNKVFYDERSISDVLYIDKIRYTSNSAIDIHMDQSAEALIGIKMYAIAPTKAALNNIVMAQAIQFVADAPVGETIYAQYNFSSVMPEAGSVSDGSYEKHPTGILIQWGYAVNTANGYASVTFPTTFVDDGYNIVASPRYSTAYPSLTFRAIPQKSGAAGCTINFKQLSGNTSYTATDALCDWIAIGRWK